MVSDGDAPNHGVAPRVRAEVVVAAVHWSTCASPQRAAAIIDGAEGLVVAGRTEPWSMHTPCVVDAGVRRAGVVVFAIKGEPSTEAPW